jgi:hypothetical protein
VKKHQEQRIEDNDIPPLCPLSPHFTLFNAPTPTSITINSTHDVQVPLRLILFRVLYILPSHVSGGLV